MSKEKIVLSWSGGKEEASGFFKEKALEIAGSLERNLVSAAHYLLSLGITSVGFVFCSPESVEFFAKEGKSLGLRGTYLE